MSVWTSGWGEDRVRYDSEFGCEDREDGSEFGGEGRGGLQVGIELNVRVDVEDRGAGMG